MQLDERKAAARIAEALRDQIEVARASGFAMLEYLIGSALVEAERLGREEPKGEHGRHQEMI